MVNDPTAALRIVRAAKEKLQGGEATQPFGWDAMIERGTGPGSLSADYVDVVEVTVGNLKLLGVTPDNAKKTTYYNDLAGGLRDLMAQYAPFSVSDTTSAASESYTKGKVIKHLVPVHGLRSITFRGPRGKLATVFEQMIEALQSQAQEKKDRPLG